MGDRDEPNARSRGRPALSVNGSEGHRCTNRLADQPGGHKNRVAILESCLQRREHLPTTAVNRYQRARVKNEGRHRISKRGRGPTLLQ